MRLSLQRHVIVKMCYSKQVTAQKITSDSTMCHDKQVAAQTMLVVLLT